MSSNYLHTGFRTKINSASGNIVAGAIVVQENISGVALTNISAGHSGWMGTSGVYLLPVPSGTVKGNALYTPGDPETTSTSVTLTKTAAGNTLFGVAESDRDSNGKAEVKVAANLDQKASTTGLHSADLGAPDLADDNYFVVSTAMKNGAYTLAQTTPDVPRNVTVTATTNTGADTPGTVLVTGTDYTDAVITETLIPAQGSTVAGTKAFKTVTSIVGSGWVTDGDDDDIIFGTGTVLGMPLALASAGQILFGTLGGGAPIAANGTANGTVSGTTADLSAGTYDGSKHAVVIYHP